MINQGEELCVAHDCAITVQLIVISSHVYTFIAFRNVP